MEIALALSQGYPRDPVYYQENLHNMLMDWACGSDLGLAMYAEYIWNIDTLDRERLAKSPEEAVKLYMEQAKDNFYAAFMAGRAKYYGYGTDKDEAKGRELIELAAGSGCVPALYLMTQLSLGNPQAEGKWKAELDNTVAAIAGKCAFMREELEKAGKSVTKKWMEDFRSRQAQQAATGQPQKGAVSEEPDWEAPAFERKQESGWDTHEKQSFQFPQYLYSDGDRGEVWELMNSGSDNVTYYCQKTGGQVFFYASDFAGGSPSGFHR